MIFYTACVVFALVFINQLPTIWRRGGIYRGALNNCMESQPPSATVVEWFKHVGECSKFSMKIVDGKP